MAHGHRLDLVVGHVDHGRGEPALEFDEFAAGLHAQGGVEIRQRLVHQEHRRSPHDRPRERDALALPTRELGRLAIEEILEVEHSRRFVDGATAFVGGNVPGAQRELDVAPHRHVRIEGIALEHHREVAILRLHAVDDAVTDPDRAGVRFLEARHRAQRGALAAARRPEQDEELVVVDLQAEIVHGHDGAEALRHPFEGDLAHGCSPSGGSAARCRSSWRPEDTARMRSALVFPDRR